MSASGPTSPKWPLSLNPGGQPHGYPGQSHVEVLEEQLAREVARRKDVEEPGTGPRSFWKQQGSSPKGSM